MVKHVTRKKGSGDESDNVKREIWGRSKGDLGRSREDPEIGVTRKERER